MRHSVSAIYLLAILGLLNLTQPMAAQASYHSLYKFQGGSDGAFPESPAVSHNGMLYGTTTKGGGSCNCGTVYQLTPPTLPGEPWTETVLYAFQGGSDGNFPLDITFGTDGNIYGITVQGGTACSTKLGCGTVYQLSPPTSSGGNWTETVLHQFAARKDGSRPIGGLAVDASGNVFGTTSQGGGNAGNKTCRIVFCGTVFELSPPATIGGTWTETILHVFHGEMDGSNPVSNVLLGPGGGLYGATAPPYLDITIGGTVFQLSPPTTAGEAWGYHVLHRWINRDEEPFSPNQLIFHGGALYGTLEEGPYGTASGVVFQLKPSSTRQWIETEIFQFTTIPGALDRGIAFDNQGNFYGTTETQTVYELSPTATGPWSGTTIYASKYMLFNGLIWSNGALFGTNYEGNNDCHCGTVYELTP